MGLGLGAAGAVASMFLLSACPTNVAVPVATASASASVVASVPAPPTWTHGAISAGDDHTCAVVKGRIACWGHNEQGQMGDGTRALRSAPQWVPGIENAVQVVAGGYHTCALLQDGTVRCWGGETTSARRTAPIVSVRNVKDAVEVVASTWMSCARTAAGQVSCWGFDGEARDVTTTAKVVSMSAGYEHVCLVEDDGVVECSIVKPVGRSADLEPIAGVTTKFDAKARVVMSATTVCVLPSGGAPVACTTLPSNPHDDVQAFRPLDGIRGATDIVAGATEICAAVGTHDALCFNSTDISRLGEESADDSFKPRSSPNLRDYASVAIGGLHRCGAKADGQIDCWGLDQGQLGLHSKRESQLVPRPVPLLNDAVELEAGLRRTCARRQDGTVSCWGIDPASPRAESQPIDQPREIDGVVQAASLQGGDEFMCAQKATGAATCWGSLTWRDCVWESADKCHAERLFTPRAFPSLLDIADAVQITNRCALKKDGSIECLRFSQAHRIGSDKISAAPGEKLKDVKMIAGQCALDGAGRVLCWGPNDHGQLGDGTRVDRQDAAPAKGISGAREIDAGDAHVCALMGDGSVRCWGDNSAGQLGDGTHDVRNTPTVVPGLTHVKHLALGDSFSCAQLDDGTAKCWGSNENGALGDGSGFDQASPVSVKDLKGIAELVAGPSHACARLENGTATCWGWSPVNQSIVNVSPDQPIHVVLPTK
ncbi:MAG: hypothetical protein U0414_12805 [Polyangiaceae bacterium]